MEEGATTQWFPWACAALRCQSWKGSYRYPSLTDTGKANHGWQGAGLLQKNRSSSPAWIPWAFLVLRMSVMQEGAQLSRFVRPWESQLWETGA